ncbi:MAG TPA: HDIG domain-containing protein [Chthonomonadaceae bacterium]|nr:HDIG domain-containing protein [Chthonomonadaceae bacterium]
MNKLLNKLWRRGRRRSTGTTPRPGATNKPASAPLLRVDWQKAGAIFITIVALSLLMTVHLMPDKIALRVGDTSPREVRASRSVYYFNSVETARRQQQARLETPPVYDADDGAAFGANHTAQQIFEQLAHARAELPPRSLHPARNQADATTQAINALQSQIGADFSRAQIRYLLTVPPTVFEKLRATTARLVKDAMSRPIRDLPLPGDIPHARREIQMAAQDELSSVRDAAIVRAVAAQALRPNRLLNQQKTAQAQEAAARRVEPIYELIQRDEKIIGKGEVVTPQHLDKFLALGLLNPRLQPTTGFAICMLAAMMVFLVAFYIARTLPALYANMSHLALLAILILLSVFGLKVGATLLGLQFSGGQLGFLGMMSVAAAGMLVSVLLDRHLAVLVVALLSVLSGLIMNHEIRFTVMTLMSSLVGIMTIGNARRKINLLNSTAALAAANLALVWLLGLLLSESPTEMVSGSVWAVASAFFATFLFWFGLQALEKPFGLLTHTQLLELSAFDQPLLKQLCAVAPGTYAHSMMVGTLAEAGAQAVGADALLCRVAGYYHDIGKMKRPEFFIENQRHENVHGRLSPSLSALIIIAHVRDGVEMAREHKLPQAIRDILAQHHGTSLIRYFYHQALVDNASGVEVPPGFEERFRYPGPKPQTREAAIVMLADSVEAAARCQSKPTPECLESLIAKLVRDNIEDGQFDECPLTFKDVKAISEAFLHVLTAMMHGRIDYPELPPRTATGRPMEVVRPDLRPEPVPLSRSQGAEELLVADAGAAAPYGAPDAVSDLEVAREITAHLDATRGINYVNSEGEYAPGEISPAPMEAVTRPSLPSRAVPLVEPEVLYGRLSVERAEPPGADELAPPGSPPPAAGGRQEPRGGERPAHG